MGLKAFKYRLYPSEAQEKRMLQVLEVCRHWYNMCLDERKTAWDLEKRTVSKSAQEKIAILYRKTFPQAKIVFSQTLQSVVDDLDKAFKAFFRRVKAKEKAGYPRFKGRHRFHSFAFKQYGSGAKIDGRRLDLFGIGRVVVRWHRPLVGKIKMVRIICKAGRWFACLICEVPDKPELPKTGRGLGVDVGLNALVTTSEGEKVDHPRFYKDSQHKLKLLQRAVARKKKGGKNRQKAVLRLQRQHEHIKNQRSDFAHKLTYTLVQNCDLIACEDLKIRNMVRNTRLSKSILDAGWGLFKQLLTNKAVDAGRQVVLVNPAYTSKCCSNCGALFADFDLATRWVDCVCGLSLDRDHNAAINILKRSQCLPRTALHPEGTADIGIGWDAPVAPNVAPLLLPHGSSKGKRVLEAARL